MNAIDDAVAGFKKVLGKTWDVRDFEDLPDKPSKPTLTVGFVDYTPAANAEGTLQSNFRFTIISPIQDSRRAQLQLDGEEGKPSLLGIALTALRTGGFVMTRTKPVVVKDAFYGYAIEAWGTTPAPY